MATDCRFYSKTQSSARKVRPTTTESQSGAQRYPLDSANGSTLGRFTRAVSAKKHLPSPFPGVEPIGSFCQDTYSVGRRFAGPWRYRPKRRFHRWNICSSEKRGDGVGKTKRGKGTKIMGLTDAGGLPLAVDATSASPHEITLVDGTLEACFLEELPERLIGDKAYERN